MREIEEGRSVNHSAGVWKGERAGKERYYSRHDPVRNSHVIPRKFRKWNPERIFPPVVVVFYQTHDEHWVFLQTPDALVKIPPRRVASGGRRQTQPLWWGRGEKSCLRHLRERAKQNQFQQGSFLLHTSFLQSVHASPEINFRFSILRLPLWERKCKVRTCRGRVDKMHSPNVYSFRTTWETLRCHQSSEFYPRLKPMIGSGF